jgi:photosystem P840 reaction center large subunit
MADQEKTGASGGGETPKKPPLQASKLQAAAKKPAAAAAAKPAAVPAKEKDGAKVAAAPPKVSLMEADVPEMKRFLLKRTETRTTKWFQVFDADKLDDEQVFGGHLALLGTLGIVMGIYYISGIQIFPTGAVGFYDNWFYLTIKPRMVSLGIDTYSPEADALKEAARKLLWWAGIHFAAGAFLIFGGWRHWTKNLANPLWWLFFWNKSAREPGRFRDFRFLGSIIRGGLGGRCAKNYSEALGAHTIYQAFLFLAWGSVMWGAMGIAPEFNFQKINAECAMAFIWAGIFFGLGFYWWNNPPYAAEHLNDDLKAIFSVHLTSMGYINIALGAFAFVAFRQDQFFYNELNKLVFYIYGEPFNRVGFDASGNTDMTKVEYPEYPAYAILPKNGATFGMARTVINLLAFNHIICGFLYVFAGVFHGGQYLLKIQMSGLYSQLKSKWIALGRDKEVQVKFVGTVMVMCFTTMISVYAVVCWNSLCELNMLGANITMSFYWLKPLPMWQFMFEDPSINDWCAVHEIAAGWLFASVATSRIAFFAHTSPLWEDLGLKKNSFSFPCLGPVYGGTCGVSIQDQLWFAILWSVKPLSVINWYIDGGWLASMNYGMAVADCNAWDSIAGLSNHYTGGVFYYMWTETQAIWASSHLTVVLLIGHLVWFISFAVWFKDRGSRLEGADIQTRTVRWLGKTFIGRDVKFRFPVLNLSDSKFAGTVLYFSGTFMLVWLYIANGFYQTKEPAKPPVSELARTGGDLLAQAVSYLLTLIS